MSKSNIEKFFFLHVLAFALLFSCSLVSAGHPNGTFDVTNATFNNFFISSDMVISESAPTNLVGDAFEVKPQLLSASFHPRNVTFNYEFIKAHEYHDFKVQMISYHFNKLPDSELIGTAFGVVPQVFRDGWHQRNNTFKTEWVNKGGNTLGIFNLLPSNQTGDASEVVPELLSASFHQKNNTFYVEYNQDDVEAEFNAEPSSSVLEDPPVRRPQALSSGFHNRNTTFKSEFLKFELSEKSSGVQKEVFVKDEFGQLLQDVQIDVFDANGSFESQHFTDENGYVLIEFIYHDAEYTIDVFKVLYKSNEIILVPTTYDTLNISMQSVSNNLWVNYNWAYVMPITISPQKDVVSCKANEKIDLNAEMIELGSNAVYPDGYSIRVIEVDASGNIIAEANTNVK
ncbi:MAG: hypothetical protein KAS30_05780 [Candidatus Diapherotrites archaeon]|nr:hypothetical protein [Candidatus Diapherotrites archaeon]